MSTDPLCSLGAHVAEQQDALLEATQLETHGDAIRRQLVQRVLERTGNGPRAPRSHAGWWLNGGWLTGRSFALAAGVALALSGLALVHRLHWGGQDALRFKVGGRTGVLQALAVAPADAGLLLSFSDGSVLELAPGSRARVAALHADGADLVLESGRARMSVVPRLEGPSAHWEVRSGPFSVQVKGTSFWLSWDPEADAFSLDLLTGQVVLTGCNLGNGRELHAGERLDVSCRTEAVDVPGLMPDPVATPPDVSRQLTPTMGPTERQRHGDLQQRLSHHNARASWQELALQGNFHRAYALAASGGWDAELRGTSREELLLLGQAARVTGHVAEAERAYRAVRHRFAGSPAAARAAFSLGLLAFDTTPTETTHWLETCLAEQPVGPLSGAALDRLLEASLRLNEPAQQRRIAQRYLEQSAHGPHAAEARRILASSKTNE